MPRTFSAATMQAAMAQETGLVLLCALTIEHENLTTPLRIVNNTEDIVSNGNTFTAVGFDIRLPEDREEGFGKAKLKINNVDQWLTPTIRSLAGDIMVTFELLSPSDLTASPKEFDNVELPFAPMRLMNVSYDEWTVEGDMTHEASSVKGFPAHRFTPTGFPGLFS